MSGYLRPISVAEIGQPVEELHKEFRRLKKSQVFWTPIDFLEACRSSVDDSERFSLKIRSLTSDACSGYINALETYGARVSGLSLSGLLCQSDNLEKLLCFSLRRESLLFLLDLDLSFIKVFSNDCAQCVFYCGRTTTC